MYERVNHPAHYGGADNPYEVIKVIEAWGLGFNLGNAVKYIGRAGKKLGAVMAAANPALVRVTKLEDLKKAAWYLNREIENIEKEEHDHAAEGQHPDGRRRPAVRAARGAGNAPEKAGRRRPGRA